MYSRLAGYEDTNDAERLARGLVHLKAQWVERVVIQTPHQRMILDMDSSESPVHGQQERATYNGHFESMCYHSLFCFNQFGDCEGSMLQPGNVHSADPWKEVLKPIVDCYQGKGVRLLFRTDAAFGKPEVDHCLEARDIGYAIRLPAKEVLQEHIRHLLKRPESYCPGSASWRRT